MTEDRWRQLTYWSLIVASLAFIVAYSWQVIADLQGAAYVAARIVIAVTWVLFAVDYVVRLSLAEHGGGGSASTSSTSSWSCCRR